MSLNEGEIIVVFQFDSAFNKILDVVFHLDVGADLVDSERLVRSHEPILNVWQLLLLLAHRVSVRRQGTLARLVSLFLFRNKLEAQLVLALHVLVEVTHRR